MKHEWVYYEHNKSWSYRRGYVKQPRPGFFVGEFYGQRINGGEDLDHVKAVFKNLVDEVYKNSDDMFVKMKEEKVFINSSSVANLLAHGYLLIDFCPLAVLYNVHGTRFVVASGFYPRGIAFEDMPSLEDPEVYAQMRERIPEMKLDMYDERVEKMFNELQGIS